MEYRPNQSNNAMPSAILPSVIPVQRVLPDALAAVLRDVPLSPEKVAFAWRTAVGPAVARATEVELRQGVLRVRAQDAAWQREVERSAGLIRVRLETLLGTGIVRGLDVSLQGNARLNTRRSTQ
jgi:hypothetical protein